MHRFAIEWTMRRKLIILLVWAGFLTTPSVAQTAADSLAIVSARWEMKADDRGVVSRCAAIEQLYGGPQYVSVVEVRPRRLQSGIGVSKTMKTISELAREYHALVAINGSYYNMTEGNSVCFLKIDDVVADSTEMREFALCVTGAVKVKKGKLRILPWNRDLERHYKKKKGVVLASGPLLLEKGRYADLSTCDSGFVATKHPRSAIAVTKDKRVLFITVDGRSPGNALGMRLPELAHLIKVMGGKEALNLDGGGSTMLYLDGEILNHPSDNGRFDHQGERRIPNIIYYYYKK